MNCSAIKLQDRRAASARAAPKSHFEGVILFSDEFHRYEFRYDKPMRPSREPNPVITEINLNFPENCTSPYSSNHSRWAQKRPRLKSTKGAKKQEKVQPETPPESPRSEDELGCSIIEDIKNEVPIVLEASDMFEENCEIDPDIQKLILESQASINNPLPNETHKKRKKKHSGKHRNDGDKTPKSSKKLIKTMSVSLSKPPSPQTVQVIRVDVVSNYSFELDEQNGVDALKTTQKTDIVNNTEEKKDSTVKMDCQDNDDSDLEIKCMRVTLAERK